MTRRITVGLLIAMSVLLIVWDIYVAINPSDGDTISEVVLAFAGGHPVLPFGMGVVCGHLLWPQRIKDGK